MEASGSGGALKKVPKAVDEDDAGPASVGASGVINN